MKEGLHPASYRYVVFKDMSNGQAFLSRSTAATKHQMSTRVWYAFKWTLDKVVVIVCRLSEGSDHTIRVWKNRVALRGEKS